MNKYLKIIAAAIFILCGCDRILMQQPKVDDLIGSYGLTPNSKKFLTEQKKYNPLLKSLIELKSGYSIFIQNLPDCAVNGFGKSNGTFLTGHGKWSIEKDSPGYGLSLDIYKGESLKAGWYGNPWIMLRRRSPPYILEIIIGDPDSGETIQYQKI